MFRAPNTEERKALCATAEHVHYCFDVLDATLSKPNGGASRSGATPHFDTSVSCPLFVTWSKRHESGRMDLRGCIGCLKPLPITSLQDYAINSAMRDQRFQPMQARELPLLHCTVSLLTDFEEARDVFDWEVGVHGILIDFVDPHGVSRSAVYLPEVMPEQGWSKLQAIDSLIRKSGYTQQIQETLRASIRLTRYKSSKLTCTYEEWRLARQKNGDLR
uniref:AMMECR1 domain-containing protein n=1 Tax=Calcidiscus leptoporus TaxID=127549 RepID=A0A7S0J3Y6_9EUKA|mmetsp:Transcript_37756/g.88332  ORF Transcript_37756/g.88332 Transcript_37756/m.88332 type:complete len:218 (+) Transcript_37756:72-725(+)